MPMRARANVLLVAVAAGSVMGVSSSAWANRPPPRRQAEPAPAPEQPAPAPGDVAKPAVEGEAPAGDAPPKGAEAAEAAMEPSRPIPPSEPIPGPPMSALGYAGEGYFPAPPGDNVLPRETIAVPDRWRIGWPTWNRYNRVAPSDSVLMNASGGDSPYTLGHPLNPYDRNILKGDYPLFYEDIFLNLTFVSDTFAKWGKLPVPSGVSTADPNSFSTFGRGEFTFVNQTFLTTFDLFKGYAGYRPVDWRLHVTGGYNVNYLHLRENSGVNINPQRDRDRTDKHAVVQEAFYEYHLGDTTSYFDIAAVQVGRQLFSSDFKGFIYNDIADGVRFFGNWGANRFQYNLALFNQVEKDTNSGLNEFDWRDQQVLIASLYIQDFIWLGYTTQFSFHWNNDNSDTRFDDNGFLVRPDLIGSVTTHSLDAYYLGWTGDGHIDRLNITHALYYVFGQDDKNPLAGRQVDISAFMAAAEFSVDFDWLRPKVSFFYASGDDKASDGEAHGFDAIIDNPVFAGGPSSFYQGSPLGFQGVRLTSPGSLLNDLSSSKTEGQSNFVNPGTILANAGFDAELTPKLRASFNANAIWFADTENVEYAANQRGIDQHLGDELNLFFQYRPILNNNIIITAGGSVFFPGRGFQDIYDNTDKLYQVFVGLTLSY